MNNNENNRVLCVRTENFSGVENGKIFKFVKKLTKISSVTNTFTL